MIVRLLLIVLLFNASTKANPSLTDFLQQNREHFQKEDTSEFCKARSDAYFDGIMKGENWALQMLDATGKIPSAIMKGNAVDLGFYDQCINLMEDVDGEIYKGNYCTFGLVIPYEQLLNNLTTFDELEVRNDIQKMLNPNPERTEAIGVSMEGTLILSVCIPDQCKPSDVFGPFGIDVSCETKDDIGALDGGDIACLLFLALIVVVMAGSTIYDLHIRRQQKKAHPIFSAFSVYSNGQKLVATVSKGNQNQVLCFNGLRSISMLWVIFGHSVIPKISSLFTINSVDAQEWQHKWYSVYILQAPLAVDTFFFLSGALMSYNFLKSMSKQGAKFNLILYYVHRYIRLTPALAAAFFLTTTIIRKIGNGPMFTMGMSSMRETCLDNWWSFFLYVQNYAVEDNNICMPHTWYLSVDMQMFLLSPLVLFPLLKYRKYTLMYLMPVLIFGSILTPFLILYLNDISYNSAEYNTMYYSKTHNRFGPWLVGIAFGALLLKSQTQKFKINKYLNLFMWLLDFVIIGVIFFTQDDIVFNHTKWKTSMYFSMYRTAWAVCLSWIVFACVNNSGGIINWFLSAPIFQILGKLSYSMYLVHWAVIYMVLFRRRTRLVFSEFENIYETLANTMLTVFVALFWTLAFESPMIIVEKIIFRNGARTKKVEEKRDVENPLPEVILKENS